jgi:hypothetical protein
MKSIVKYAVAIVLTGALVLAAATPSEACNGRWTAAAIGFGAGALVGAAAANAAYNGGYSYGPGYYYAPGYAYTPAYGYYDAYAYAPGPGYGYYGSRWSDEHSTDNFSISSQR